MITLNIMRSHLDLNNRLSKRTKLMFAIAAIVVVSAPLRLYRLNTRPPGLFGDEAADGLDALHIIAGKRPVYLTDNNGREPMHAYLVALSVSILGRTPAAVRAPSALASIITVFGIFLVSHSLFGQRVALLTALIGGFTVWPIMLGRLATRPALLPLFLAFSLWMGITAWRRASHWRWVLSGIIFGAGLYTYTPIRVMLLVPILWSALILVNGSARRLYPGAAMFLIALALTCAPFANFALKHSDLVFGRSSGVAIISLDDSPNHILSTLASQTTAVLPMFMIPGRGDWNLRHNIPNRAAFDPAMAFAFALGMLVVFNRKHRRHLLALLIWIAVALLPTILSEEPPHFGRSSGALPVLFIFPAIGLCWAHRNLERYTHRIITIVMSAGILLASIFMTTRDYLMRDYLGTPAAGFWFDEQCTLATREINRFLGNTRRMDGLITSPTQTHTHRQVFIAPNVCPRYSSSGYHTVQFLVPQELGNSSQFQRYDLSALPPLTSLKQEVLILSIPGDEEQLLPWLEASFSTSTSVGPWTPPVALGNSWLVYRSIEASRK